jgi:hypothetical protein
MDRMQPYYKLHRKRKVLEVWGSNNRGVFHPAVYDINEDQIPIIEKLIVRDKMTALLYRKSDIKFIADMCYDIIENNG